MSNNAAGAADELEEHLKAPRITTLNTVSVVIAAVLVIVSIVVVGKLLQLSSQSDSIHDRYDECSSAAIELRIASDYLTTQCRMFVMTGDTTYLDAYFEELNVTKRRDEAAEVLGQEAGEASATAQLNAALGESNKLAELELGMRRGLCA